MSGLDEQRYLDVCPNCKEKVVEYYISYGDGLSLWWESPAERKEKGLAPLILDTSEFRHRNLETTKDAVFLMMKLPIQLIVCTKCGEDIFDNIRTEYSTFSYKLEEEVYRLLSEEEYMTWDDFIKMDMDGV